MNQMEQEKCWIAQAVSGDQDALEALLCSVQDMVFNLSLRMLGIRPDAEDATQEIFIQVMTHLSSFRQESSLSTWVFRIAAEILDLTPEAYCRRRCPEAGPRGLRPRPLASGVSQK